MCGRRAAGEGAAQPVTVDWAEGGSRNRGQANLGRSRIALDTLRLMSGPPDPKYWVYVIEFDANWIEDAGKGTVYVGFTARTPEQRIETHRTGGRTAAAMFKAGRKRRGTNLRLRQDLASAKPSHAGPWTSEHDAMTHERKLANRLKAHGYVVEVGLGRPFQLT